MKLLPPSAVAEILAVSRSTVLRLIADGSLPAICLRRGRKKAVLRVRDEVLQKWILAKEKTRTKVPPVPTNGHHDDSVLMIRNH
jgi:excisionase family DNA binding protein